METRNLALESELTVLYQNLIPDARNEVVAYAPRGVSTLFAMSSSYWRSYFYLQQLQVAVAEKQLEEQERILTHLMVNVALLKKSEAHRNLPQWIAYLPTVFLNEKVVFQSRLLAQALYLMINENRKQRELAEFEFIARSWYPGSSGKIAVFLALQAMVADVYSIKTESFSLNIADLLSGKSRFYLLWSYASLANKYEAQLIVALLDKIGCSLMDVLFGLLDADVGVSDRIRLVNACVNRMSSKHAFWKKKKYLDKRFIRLFLVPHFSVSDDAAADLMLSVARNISDADVEKIAKKLKAIKKKRLLRANVMTAKRFCKLQNDDDRIVMLNSEIEQACLSEGAEGLFYVEKISRTLTADGARGEAVRLLTRCFEGSHNHIWFNKLANIINMLLGSIVNQSVKMATVDYLCKLRIPHNFRFVYEFQYMLRLIVQWLPSTAYQQRLDDTYQKYLSIVKHIGSNSEHRIILSPVNIDLLKKFCEVIESLLEVDQWLTKFKLLVDLLDDKLEDSCKLSFHFAYKCFNNLVCKKKDPGLLRAWLDKLHAKVVTTKEPIECEFYLHLAMEVLPLVSLAEEDNIKWLALIYQFSVSQTSRKFFTPEYRIFYDWLSCLNDMLPRLSPALQSEYSSKIYPMLAKNALLTTDKAPRDEIEARIFGRHCSLLNLLHALPDEVVFNLSPTTPRLPQTPSPAHTAQPRK